MLDKFITFWRGGKKVQKAYSDLERLKREKELPKTENREILHKNDVKKASWTIFKHVLISRGLLALTVGAGVLGVYHGCPPAMKFFFGYWRSYHASEIEPGSGNEIGGDGTGGNKQPSPTPRPTAEELKKITKQFMKENTYKVVKHVEMLANSLGEQLSSTARNFPDYQNLIGEIGGPLALVKINEKLPEKCFVDLIEKYKTESMADIQKIINTDRYRNHFFYASGDPGEYSTTIYIPANKSLLIPELFHEDGENFSFDDMDIFYLYYWLAIMMQDFKDRGDFGRAHNGDISGYLDTFEGKITKDAWHIKATGLLLEVINLKMKNRLWDYAERGEEPPYDGWIKEFKLRNSQNETRLRQLLSLAFSYFPHRLKTEQQQAKFEKQVKEKFVNLD